jgi:hypothetical protein
MEKQLRLDELLELLASVRATYPEIERLRAECDRAEARMDEIRRKRRALDAVNPIGGLTESRWRELDAAREAVRRMAPAD